MSVFQERMSHKRNLKIYVLLAILACSMFFSSKSGSLLFANFLEQAALPLSASAAKGSQAIVVLTGGDALNLEAARLHQETGLSVLASGGNREAATIKRYLEKRLHIPVRWTEERSLNTEQNAKFVAEILKKENIHKIVLVTHALHMRRAQIMFVDQGIEVIPAPTRFSSGSKRQWSDFLPSTEGLNLTKSTVHELCGRAYYVVRRTIL